MKDRSQSRIGTREERRLPSELYAFRRLGTIHVVAGTRHGSRKMYTLRHIGMAVRE